MFNKMQLMMITNIPEIAQHIEQCGVSRIFLDMETLNKEDRQKNLDLPNNCHSFEDVTRVKKAVSSAEVMLRINPLHSETEQEIQKALDAGADCIMLPFFHHQDEVKQFLDLLDGRAKSNILLETAGAAGRAHQILSLNGLDEVHFGLNDLKISLNHKFLFESFSGGLIEFLCKTAASYDLSYGIGGVGRVGKELLPADLILKEHVRLGSQRVILSRVFHGGAKNLEELNAHVNFQSAIDDIRQVEVEAHARNAETIAADTLQFRDSVEKVVHHITQSAQ